jgi:hypothetical protein
MRRICFQWIEPCANERLRQAQAVLRDSVSALGLEPVLFPAGPDLVKFRDVLQFARDHASGPSFVWCNSDVMLRRDPHDVEDGLCVHGFHRTEIPSGEVCGGVDMYLIPCAAWDDWLRDDAPELWCGATHIDWWLTRTAARRGIYRRHEGYIDHRAHASSAASKNKGDKHYGDNIRAYNAWAERNGEKIHAPDPEPSVPLRFLHLLAWKAGWKIRGLTARLRSWGNDGRTSG